MKGELCFTGQGIPHFSNAIWRLTLTAALAVALGGIFLAPPVRAVPYASAVSNNAGTVSFILNEAADNVTVVFDGGATSSDLGALAAGLHSFPLGGATSYSIEVSKLSGLGYLVGVTNRISSETNVLTYFFAVRGVAVNRNPSSPNFGRVYVSEANGGTSTVPGTRTVTDGIYLLNADLTDAVGQGDTARTGGLTFSLATQNVNTPWKMEVGEDDTLFIADWTTNQGTIWITDADVTTGSTLLAVPGAISNLTVHTTIVSSPIPVGSLAAGNLKVWAIDGRWPGSGNRNRLLRWDINAGPLPWNSAPTPLGSAGNGGVNDVYCDVDRGPDGKLYVLQNRFDGTDTDSLRVFDTDGTTFLWRSQLQTGSPDVLRQIRAVKVSPDGKVIALNKDDGRTWIIGLTNGIPDMSRTNLLDTFVSANSTGRDLAFDAAGNLYIINNTLERLRVFSPGGNTKTITRSDGTFTVVRPPPASVEVLDAQGHENGPDTVVFSIYRSGDTSNPMTVHYALSGTATAGLDYLANNLSATIPIGATNVLVTITPEDDTEAERAETVVLTLVPRPEYDLGAPASGTGYILDNETPHFTLISTRALVYEDSFYYNPEFVLTRLGETNVEVLVSLETTNSTASEGNDVTFIVPTIDVPPGVIQRPFSVILLRDDAIEGDETLGITIVPGFDSYTIGTPHTASVTIRDNDSPECVIFRDDFEMDSSPNWITRFGANNGVFDATIFFVDDYSLRGIPSAPHSAGSTTLGLFVQVNKAQATPAGSAGINFYPMQQAFSGDYALRFDLFLSFGGASTTEHALAGLNHSSTLTNRVTQSANPTNPPAGGDGIFVAIETDGSANREWAAYTFPTPTSLPTMITNRSAASVSNLVTSPPYSVPGSPGNNAAPPAGGTNFFQWADVELRQQNSVISLRVNNDLIYSFPNTSGFNSGNVMIGMNDQFDSVGGAAIFAIFDNVRVIDLNPIRITSVQLPGGSQVQIDFIAPCVTSASELYLQSAAEPTSPSNFTDDAGATISAIPGGWRATTTQLGPARYYRIRR